MKKNSIPQKDKLNPSSRFLCKWKVCSRCQKIFFCNESYITEKNLEEWEEKVKQKPSLKKNDGPLLCKERRICLCDECRTRGGTRCQTKFVRE